MRTSLRTLTVAGALLIAAATTALSQSATAAPSDTGSAHRAVKVCATATAGTATCHAWVRTDLAPAAVPSGFGPADLRSAYNLTTSGSSATTVAVVDAYDAPTAEADLAAYRSQYGLSACTTANGCFRKIDQDGGTNYPHRNTGWA